MKEDKQKKGYSTVEGDEEVPLEEDEKDKLKGTAEQKTDRAKKEAALDKVFIFFQVMTASFESFAHGANDTANAIGPFAAVYFLYTTGGPSTGQLTPWWILAAGGAGIVLGLATFGRQVMKTIGVKLTHVNYTRGFSIELSSALCVVLASRLGFPISTTHCKVGSVVAVGTANMFLHKTKYAPIESQESLGVSWSTFGNVAVSWLITVPISAVVSSGLFGYLVHALIKQTEPFPPPCNSTIPGNMTIL